MAEAKRYAYAVLVLIDFDARTYRRLGNFTGRTPDEAIEVAANEKGTPDEHGGAFVAVPLRSWHARPVKRSVEPSYEVGEAEDVFADEPAPPEPEEPGEPAPES